MQTRLSKIPNLKPNPVSHVTKYNGGNIGWGSQRGVNVPADTQREVINADGKPGCDSL